MPTTRPPPSASSAAAGALPLAVASAVGADFLVATGETPGPTLVPSGVAEESLMPSTSAVEVGSYARPAAKALTASPCLPAPASALPRRAYPLAQSDFSSIT